MRKFQVSEYPDDATEYSPVHDPVRNPLARMRCGVRRSLCAARNECVMIFEGTLTFDSQTHPLHSLTRFSSGVNMVARRTDWPLDAGVPIDREHGTTRLEQSSHRAQRLVAHLVQNVERKHPICRTAQPRDFRGMYRTEICECFCRRLRPQQIEHLLLFVERDYLYVGPPPCQFDRIRSRARTEIHD